ncbi:uncharacterized protein PODANS_1_8915 [Podospora anserina S mat+]|uniref:Podospora anserina S mat+ genomic DNA chromosome 1, supercontig 2 n=4 Tax=Podospora TaxID=5144 RepID=B2AXV0_PODAN|nr:uncharacterized protein PODANS_1_8915 [Podospora anserina S mat+]KAK4659297.1 hypothetical protein QC762_108915 [Podospora pseudocomata]KAK4673111.1 hypothetical protein QC763_108915 [Podospora pseudopauciseta]VBB72344.1 Putative protein of unknown function [Podospora comata]CAP69224.1 unnamed protein product [Podospora anserina S mat+]CDP23247.1 Putative protein of unknown function [Podospora anserina S mat+]
MKFQAILIATLSATGLASPVPEPQAKPKFVQAYTLRLSSRTPSLDGKPLTLSNTTLGIFPSSPSTPLFYPIRNPQTNLLELHSPQTSSALALVGTHGLLSLSALPNPASVTVPTGTTLDWQNFDLSDDASAGSLTYAGSTKDGSWVAFPVGKGQAGEWAVKWKDVTATTTQNYIPVKVVYEVVEGFHITA